MHEVWDATACDASCRGDISYGPVEDPAGVQGRGWERPTTPAADGRLFAALLSPLHPECPAGRCGVSHAVRQSAASAEADGIRACLQRGKPHCWEPVCARAAGEAAIRINHYGHAPLTEQNHTYIGAGEMLVDDQWAATLSQSLFENR